MPVNSGEPIEFLRSADGKSPAAAEVSYLVLEFAALPLAGCALGAHLLKPLGGSSVIEYALALAVVLFAILYVRAVRQRVATVGSQTPRGSRTSGLRASQGSKGRVQCTGESSAFRDYGGFPDVAFEPAIFWGALAVPLSRLGRSPWSILTAVGYFAVLLLGYRGLSGDWPRLEPHGIVAALVFLWTGLLLAHASEVCLFPTYLRMVPGRLDVLRYCVFRGSPIERREYDLHQSAVRVDLERRVVVIGGEQGATEFSVALIPHRRRFAYMLLLAAISTHRPGPLAIDDLLG